jgi:diketogulonate reductase-like aldo/keto reductase
MDIRTTVNLSNGVKMPVFGLGVFMSKEGLEVESAVETALEAGYRHIDTAAVYGNERGVGRAIRRSGIPRKEIFITSKVWNSDQGYLTTFDAFLETWKAMEEIYASGRAKAIGVSNFLVHHLEELLPQCKVAPMVDQVEFHPYLQQPDLQSFCRSHAIQFEAWSPIMKGRVNEIPLLQELAAQYGKTPVQVTLRWELQKGIVAIPKSVHRDRILSNAGIFDFEISGADMGKIDSLDRHHRVGADPDHINF